MTLTVATLIFNQLFHTKGYVALLKYITAGDCEFLVIDNGSTEPVYEFLHDFLKPANLVYVKNSENLGTVLGMQQIWEKATGDIIAVFHNDVAIYEYGWDQRVIELFEDDPKLGLIGLFGSSGIWKDGGRIQLEPSREGTAGMSNMLEAELHGNRIDRPYPIAIADAFALIFRKEMLDKGKGFDLRYKHHHFYDKDICLESLKRGYHNMVMDIPCHHPTGLTSEQGEYHSWASKQMGIPDGGDKMIHDTNSEAFIKKWGPKGYDVLPLYVNKDFSFSVQPFTGDRITKL